MSESANSDYIIRVGKIGTDETIGYICVRFLQKREEENLVPAEFAQRYCQQRATDLCELQEDDFAERGWFCEIEAVPPQAPEPEYIAMAVHKDGFEYVGQFGRKGSPFYLSPLAENAVRFKYSQLPYVREWIQSPDQSKKMMMVANPIPNKKGGQ